MIWYPQFSINAITGFVNFNLQITFMKLGYEFLKKISRWEIPFLMNNMLRHQIIVWISQ